MLRPPSLFLTVLLIPFLCSRAIFEVHTSDAFFGGISGLFNDLQMVVDKPLTITPTNAQIPLQTMNSSGLQHRLALHRLLANAGYTY